MIFVIEALILCLIFTVIVTVSVYRNPKEWISDYPPAIQARCRELGITTAESGKMPPKVIARKVIASAVSALVFALVLIRFNGAESFREGLLFSYGLWLIVDWYDALILDCLWFCHSRKVIIPGTEDMVDEYHNYGFHIKMSLIGMAIGLPVCVMCGILVQFMH